MSDAQENNMKNQWMNYFHECLNQSKYYECHLSHDNNDGTGSNNYENVVTFEILTINQIDNIAPALDH